MPSFTIQSSLDKMPGQNFETDKFVSEMITSKYFTKRIVSQQIASSSKRIDELRSLLTILKHLFDVIGITETKLHDEIPHN